ncbi:protein phosphatase-2B, putative [Entamoeba invadens IP1]|uniref:Protein phosphatase-2B, putative n=1 Tax=Entamoeba invadens IP1 TaxID=370355 RepID=L7FJ83_ENTIV|nr:protein phosphatase-2B, putative [Entamoeba invadens IP1]ELP83964.1 protein phosphatase-2B, putative [Entamoeba invadens IP1]|eukprot:XP_004183310.1 protein phosphatase-2B, putative [Entamoeba invadens IP1]
MTTKMGLNLRQIDGEYDLMEIQEHFMKGGVLSTDSVMTLIKQAKDILKSEPNLITVKGPSLIFGDFHGQYFDLLYELMDEFSQLYGESFLYYTLSNLVLHNFTINKIKVTFIFNQFNICAIKHFTT